MNFFWRIFDFSFENEEKPFVSNNDYVILFKCSRTLATISTIYVCIITQPLKKKAKMKNSFLNFYTWMKKNSNLEQMMISYNS